MLHFVAFSKPYFQPESDSVLSHQIFLGFLEFFASVFGTKI